MSRTCVAVSRTCRGRVADVSRPRPCHGRVWPCRGRDVAVSRWPRLGRVVAVCGRVCRAGEEGCAAPPCRTGSGDMGRSGEIWGDMSLCVEEDRAACGRVERARLAVGDALRVSPNPLRTLHTGALTAHCESPVKVHGADYSVYSGEECPQTVLPYIIRVPTGPKKRK